MRQTLYIEFMRPIGHTVKTGKFIDGKMISYTNDILESMQTNLALHVSSPSQSVDELSLIEKTYLDLTWWF